MIDENKLQSAKGARQKRMDFLRKPRWVIGIGVVAMIVSLLILILAFANYVQDLLK